MIVKAISIFATAVIVILVAVFLSTNPQILIQTTSIPPKYFVLILFLQTSNLLINMMINKLIFGYKKSVTVFDSYLTTTAAAFLNMVLPLKTGTSLQAIILKKKYGLSLTWFAATFYAVTLLMIIFVSMLGLLSLVLLQNAAHTNLSVLIFFFISVLTLSAIALIIGSKISMYSRNKAEFIHIIIDKVGEIHNGILKLMVNKTKFGLLVLLIILNIITLLLIIYVEVSALNISISAPFILLFFCISVFSLVINITPNNIGIKEFVQLLFTKTISLTPSNILQIGVLDRTTLFITLTLLFLLALIINFWKMNRNTTKKLCR